MNQKSLKMSSAKSNKDIWVFIHTSASVKRQTFHLV